MLEFRKINIDDRDRVREILSKSNFIGCEYSFANNLAWNRLYETYISFYEDFYISMSEKNGLTFTFPAGEGDYEKLFYELSQYAERKNSPLRVSSVTEENLSLMKNIMGNCIVEESIGGADYIYNSKDLKGLEGKKYHKKRNHLKKIENYNYSFSLLEKEDFDECIAFAAKNYNEKESTDISEIHEQYAIDIFFKYFDRLNLSGGVLRVDNEVKAFTIGEAITPDTADIHIEKADKSVLGAYAAINNFYAKSLPENIRYINREEDLGIEGLKKAKESYYPEILLKKYILTKIN